MTLQEHIANIGAKATDYSPQTLLAFINMILNMVYAKNLVQTRNLTDTGMPPFLTTRNNVREYRFPENSFTYQRNGNTIDVPVRFVECIFTDYNIRSSYGRVSNIWPTYEFNGIEYYKPPIDSFEKTERDPANIRLSFNPGDSTNRYYILFYMSAPKLYTMNDEIYIPSANDMYITFAVLWLIKNEDYGDEKALTWIEGLVKKMQRNLSFGSGDEGVTRVQPENRRYE